MCLVVFAWNAVRGRRLVLVGNRDEMHSRPTASMAWWREPRLLGGRDLSAGGTWLGVDGHGRFGVVTNYRGAGAPPGAPSRGTLIPRYLAGELGPAAFLEALAGDAHRYAGFSLLVGDAHGLGYFCNREPGPPRLLAAGVYGLSNATLDAPWPKLVNSRAALAARIAAPFPRADALLDLLADRAPAAEAELPDTGVGIAVERRLSAAFILGDEYGTRSTTALVLGADGGGAIVERSYAADGSAVATRRFRLERGAP
jgi:uncharacterized protein with NRDE domain